MSKEELLRKKKVKENKIDLSLRELSLAYFLEQRDIEKIIQYVELYNRFMKKFTFDLLLVKKKENIGVKMFDWDKSFSIKYAIDFDKLFDEISLEKGLVITNKISESLQIGNPCESIEFLIKGEIVSFIYKNYHSNKEVKKAIQESRKIVSYESYIEGL